jgi:hypothetical protein
MLLIFHWVYNVQNIFRQRFNDRIFYNKKTQGFYFLSLIIILSRVVDLIWFEPPYGNNVTILTENIAVYSMMYIGCLQISYLIDINGKIKYLTKNSILDRTEFKENKTNIKVENTVLVSLLLIITGIFILDSILNVKQSNISSTDS